MAETPLQYHRPLVPLGLGYLGAVLEQHYSDGRWEEYVRDRLAARRERGYEPSGIVAAQDNMLRSFYGKYDFDQLRERIGEHARGCPPDKLFIGFSVLSDGMQYARPILRRLRTEFPLANFMVGGPHATFFPYDFYERPESREGPLADYIVRNEGENAILGIVGGALERESDLKLNYAQYGVDLSGCDYTDPEYRIIDGGQYGANSDRVGLRVLDQLPVPAYFLFEEEGRLPYEPDRRYQLDAPAANINSSRGCPHGCTFCTIPMLAPGYRTLSPMRMMDIAKFLVIDYGVKSLFFREDNFMYSGGKLEGDRWADVEEFCGLIRDEGLRLRWAIEARADNLLQPANSGPTRIDVMQRAGLKGIYIGIESGSALMLKLYAKGAKVSDMNQAVKACVDRKVAIVATTCYSDPDLALRSHYPLIDLKNNRYRADIFRQRETILQETRAFMDAHAIPLNRREEYVMCGIPVSTMYRLLDREREQFPALVEYYDPQTRYIYPKGFAWWSGKLYDTARRVRPYLGYDYSPPGAE